MVGFLTLVMGFGALRCFAGLLGSGMVQSKTILLALLGDDVAVAGPVVLGADVEGNQQVGDLGQGAVVLGRCDYPPFVFHQVVFGFPKWMAKYWLLPSLYTWS